MLADLYKKYNALILLVLITCVSCENAKDQLAPREALGHYLFFDTHLSTNNTKSCASCHDPQFAFTDGYRKSVSPLGENLRHNAPSLLNTQQYHFYDWDNPAATDYLGQMQRPLYGKNPVELGLDLHWEAFKKYLQNDAIYAPLITKAFGDGPFTKNKLEEAIAAYLKTLESRNTAFDAYANGNKNALSPSAKRGLVLFNSKKLKCVQCHTPPDFTKVATHNDVSEVYANIGLYNVRGQHAYPKEDRGLEEHTQNEEDNGKFRIPSLRNVALTAPYMHDGSVASLDAVLDIYAQGGRGSSEDAVYGNGPANKRKDELITGFEITQKEKKDLISFLESLTDTTYLQHKNFLNPFSY